jgi:CRISPR-associated protein Csm1
VPLNQREYQTVILAAFLHDIGKFWQRTGLPHDEAYSQFTEQDYGRHGAHSKWSANFIERYVAAKWQACASPVFYHHNPQDRLSRIVCVADWLSSGERQRSEETAWQLRPVFAQIKLSDEAHQPSQHYYYPLRPLEIDDQTVFPSPQARLSEEKGPEAYKQLWNLFLKGHSLLPKDDFGAYFTNLCSLFLRYAWCIPSAGYKTVPDITLFDHSATTSALAACLYLTDPDDSELIRLTSSLDELYSSDKECFLFIEGNLSGIQSYLYEIANVGAGGVAKRLRARSFYLSCLVEASAHRLLHSVATEELPITCNLTSSGGKFLLVAPNLPEVKQKLRSVEVEVNRWLYSQFQGELTMLFGAVPVSPGDFQPGRISHKLAELEDETNKQKTAKLCSLLVGNQTWNTELFLWQQEDYPHGDCLVCHKMPASASDERVCHRCSLDRIAGEQLTSALCVAYSKQRPEDGIVTFPFFDNPPYFASLVKNEKAVPAGTYLVETLNADGLSHSFPSLRRFLANHVPLFKSQDELDILCHSCSKNKAKCDYKDQIKSFPAIYSFHCMAAASDGAELLGILKGDVDRLGLILSIGLGDKASLSRIATLSRQLDLFFSGWMNYALQTNFNSCYTVYSGGDDFLILGPWDRITELARYINSNLARFVAHNKDVTLSAGIAVTKPTFPISRSSQQADGCLDIAKEEGRDRIHLFNVTAPWTSKGHTDSKLDYEHLMDCWAEFLYQCLEQKKFSLAFAHRLLGYVKQCREYLHKGQPQSLLYLSHLAYDIARNIEEREEYVRQRLASLTDFGNRELMAQLTLPLTWALLKHRR